MRIQPSIGAGLFVYLGYIAIVSATSFINGTEYYNIGKNAENMKLWYAIPTLLGSAFVLVTISIFGWWRIVLFDKEKARPKWVWILPILMLAFSLFNYLLYDPSVLSKEVWLWGTLGAVGVGFGEEMITRGAMLVGLRNHFTEGKAWLFSTLLFSALHIPNVFFGLPASAMIGQLFTTFLLGSGLYVCRRITGTLLVPMILHGLWDSSIFMAQIAGLGASIFQLAMPFLSIICLIAVMRKQWNLQIE